MSDNVKNIVTKIIDTFNGIPGIDAVVLGGSRATGTANKDSDIDIGIYYNKGLFDHALFREKAVSLDDKHRKDVITELGDWGPWINGGGWLKIDSVDVDILFRDTQKVTTVMDDCIHGKISIDYQCGHPFGFVSSIYMGEIAYCKILNSKNSNIPDQKKRLEIFPETYRKAAIEKFLWECAFSLKCGLKAIEKKDILYASGSLFRSAVCLLQVLYAINGMYMLNEKGALKRLLSQKGIYIPDNFVNEIEDAFSELKNDTLQSAFEKMQTQYDMIFQFINQNLKL